jgi:hypothetical protein
LTRFSAYAYFILGESGGSELFMPARPIPFHCGRRSSGTFLLPLHHLPSGVQATLCGCHGFSSGRDRFDGRQRCEIQALPVAACPGPRDLPGLRGARRRFYGVRPAENVRLCFRKEFRTTIGTPKVQRLLAEPVGCDENGACWFISRGAPGVAPALENCVQRCLAGVPVGFSPMWILPRRSR